MDATDVGNLPECQNCGARLPRPAADGTRTCEYCEAVYQPPSPPKPPPQMAAPPNLGGWSSTSSTTSTSRMTADTTYVRSRKTKPSGCGWVAFLMFAIIAASVGIPAYFAIRENGGFGALLRDQPAGPVAMLPNDAAAPPTTIFAITQKRGTSPAAYNVARLNL